MFLAETSSKGEVELIKGSHWVNVWLELVRSKADVDCNECDVVRCFAMFLAETSSKGKVELIKGLYGVDVMDTEVDVP